MRLIACMANVVLPGTGLVLRHPGLIGVIWLLISVAGLTLLAIALAFPGSYDLTQLGWVGLGLYGVAALGAALVWFGMETHSTRDPAVIGPLYHAAAGKYLRDELDEAEREARKLVRLAGDVPGAWRLLGMVLRARGRVSHAQRCERRAERLEMERG